MNLDYYKILGVAKNASQEDIRKAYKKLAIKYHPDKNDGEELSTEIFKSVKEAYETLSDSHKKSSYDSKKAHTQQQRTQPQQPKTHYKAYRRKVEPKGMSDKKAYGIAIGIMATIIIIILTLYPILNKWASNDKLETAQKMVRNENWTEAYVYASAAIEQWDENGKAYLIRAQIKSGIYNKYQSALVDFNQAFLFIPEDSITGANYYMRAKCKHELGKVADACKDLEISYNKGFQQADDDMVIICK